MRPDHRDDERSRRGSDRPRTATVIALCALVLAPTLAYRMGSDQGAFAHMAAGILRGEWPYLSSWESQFPGLGFLQAIEIAVFGKSPAMFRLFDVLFQLANAYLIFRIADKLSGRVAALVAAVLFCLIYQGYGPWNTAQREGFGMLFLLAGFWLYFTAARRSPLLTAATIGFGIGLAVTIKPTLLAMALFYTPLITQVRDRRTMTVAGAALAGLVAPLLILVAGYWAVGGLTAMYEACIAFQTVYTAQLRGHDPLVFYWFYKLRHLGANAALLPLVYIPFLFFGGNRRGRLMMWLALVGSVYSVFVQGTYAGYHYLPGMAVGATLVGHMFSTVVDRLVAAARLPSSGRLPSAQLIAAQLLLAAAAVVYMRHAPIRSLVTLQFLEPPRPNEFRNATVFDFTESFAVAAYLRERTPPDQPIQVWGYEPIVYYLAERSSASRFQATDPLVMRVPGENLTPMQQRWRAEFVGDLERKQPSYVAVVRQDNWWWAPEQRTSEALLDDFPEWKHLIARDYRLDTTIGRFLVYRRAATAN